MKEICEVLMLKVELSKTRGESANRDFFRPTHPPKNDPRKNLNPAKILNAAKDFDPCNPRKNYDPRTVLTHVKSILTHVTHAAHRPTQPTQLCYHAAHAI